MRISVLAWRMWNTVLAYCLDLLAYCLVAIVLTWVVDRRVRRRGPEFGLGRRAWQALFALLLCAVGMSFGAGEHEREQLKRSLEGFAPTYAAEMSKHGHSKIAIDTAADDPNYLELIETEKRWLAVNPAVNDIYTFRRRADGKFVFIVDSETDYNHNGKYDEEREQRTPIGEVYERMDPAFMTAIKGEMGFEDEPFTDRWGTWVSAACPIYGPDGKVEAGLGVDFDAALWVRSILLRRAGVLGFFAVALTILVWSGWLIALSRERERLQRKLVEMSRQAGMAEVATGVLHNVGNVLNTVNVSTHLLADQLRQSRASGVERAAKLLKEQKSAAEFLTVDERGRQFPEYLEKLGEALKAEQQGLQNTVRELGEGIEHIKSIVQAQQTLATGARAAERLHPGRLFDEAVRLHIASGQTSDVEIVRELEDIPWAVLDRHKVLQVLVNLVSNARNATEEAKQPKPQITLRMKRGTLDNGQGSIRFEVSDNGVGIPPENMTKIFAFGFTTRSNGHGFGLPTAANMASEMGGRLTAHSEGAGRGATFVLELPLEGSEVHV